MSLKTYLDLHNVLTKGETRVQVVTSMEKAMYTVSDLKQVTGHLWYMHASCMMQHFLVKRKIFILYCACADTGNAWIGRRVEDQTGKLRRETCLPGTNAFIDSFVWIMPVASKHQIVLYHIQCVLFWMCRKC